MDWSYIAGFFDGEGSIVKISGGSYSYRIAIAQNSTDVLEQIQDLLDCYGIHSWITRKKSKVGNDGYHLAFAKQSSVILFLEQIKDIVIVKHDKVIEVLEYLSTQPWNDIKRQQANDIIEFHKQGYSQRTIAAIVGISQGKVWNVLQEEELKLQS